jgi:hypothetical protein
MTNIASAKILMETVNAIAVHLTIEEISDIGVVLIKAMERMEAINGN